MTNAPETPSTSLLRTGDAQSELDSLERRHQALGRHLLAVLNATAGRARTLYERVVIDELLLEMQRIRVELHQAG